MANAAGMINEGLWRKDKDFQRVPRLAQCTFCQILSQKDLDTAGILTLHMDLLAKACDELTVEQLRADFAVLEDRRFLFVDYDTDEILVRSYVRLVSGVSPQTNNAWKSVPKNARILASPKLRHELAVELRRLRYRPASDLADEIDPIPTPLEPPPNPVGTGSEGGSPSEGGSNPPSQVPVKYEFSPSVVGSVGVQRARPNCPDHETDSDTNCRMCMRRRLWDEEHAKVADANELDERRRRRELRENCTRCHGENTYEDAAGVHPCDHLVKCTDRSLMGSPCEGAAGHPGPHFKTHGNQKFEWTPESQARFIDQWGAGGT